MQTSLPNEILMKFFKLLSLRDSRNLASTCRRLFDMLPSVLRSLDLKELVLGDGRVAPPIDFLTRNGLHSRIEKVRVDIANGDETLAAYLKNIFDSCPNVQALVLENSSSLPSDPAFLRDFLGTISVREFHCENHIAKAAVSFPQNVDKCTINLFTLAEMYGHYVRQQPPTEDETHFLGSMKSLCLWCDEQDDYHNWCDERGLFPHSAWRMLSEIPHLDELALSGNELPFPNDDWHPRSSLKTLTLEQPISPAAVNHLIQGCPFVEEIYFSLRILDHPALPWHFLELRDFSRITWPTAFKKIHLYGASKFDHPVRYTDLFFRQLSRLNLETVTVQEFLFKSPFGGLRIPDFAKSNINISGFDAGVLKDWFVTIHKPTDWTDLVTLLRPVPRLEHLHVHVQLDNEYDAAQIKKVYPKIATEIACLSVNESHFEEKHFGPINILTSFANIGNYNIHSAGNSQFFRVCQDWSKNQRVSPSSAWRLDLYWYRNNKYDQLRNFSKVTHLIMKSVSIDIQIDLEKIKDVVGANLRFLQVSHYGYSNSVGIPIIDPSKIGSCLNFPKLQHFSVEQLNVSHFEAFLQSLESLKHCQSWPHHLKSIWLLFYRHDSEGIDDDDDKAKTIVVQNCGLGVSVRVSRRIRGELKWDAS